GPTWAWTLFPFQIPPATNSAPISWHSCRQTSSLAWTEPAHGCAPESAMSRRGFVPGVRCLTVDRGGLGSVCLPLPLTVPRAQRLQATGHRTRTVCQRLMPPWSIRDFHPQVLSQSHSRELPDPQGAIPPRQRRRRLRHVVRGVGWLDVPEG